MRYCILLLFVFQTVVLTAQNKPLAEEGEVTFVTSKNVYVKFASTENINPGDTLFFAGNAGLVPALTVVNKSSSSTVCQALGDYSFKKGDKIFNRTKLSKQKNEEVEKRQEETTILPDDISTNIANDPVVKPVEDREEEVLFKEKIKGRLSAASYSNFSDFRNTHRMRYAFSYRGYNLKNSRFSTENYITFRHSVGDSVRLADALKVYALSVRYDFDKSSRLIFGRKINPKFSSMGAVDGLQYEKGFGNFVIGAIAGTRPDFQDYSFNFNLLQFGAYAGWSSNKPGNISATTLGFIEQMNKGNTDRRFVYFQHSGQLAKNLNLFSSFEVDLYEKINNEVKNQARFTNLFVSLRYRFNKTLRLSASYDNRRNIIYYESFQSFIDQLIDDETRQGFRLGLSHRATPLISWGVNAGTRFQKSGQNPSRNLSSYVAFNRLPFINVRATLRANFLQTNFLDSQIFGARLSKELIKGKLSGELYYRWVDYKYKVGDRILHQDIGGASLNFRLRKNLSLFVFWEGVFENTNKQYQRFNVKLIQRF